MSAITQQCGICGSFIPKPAEGATVRVCPKCGTEFEVPPQVPDTHWEYIVCFAPGYPDPYRPHPNTLEEARKFAANHRWNFTTKKAAHPVIKRRLVSEWEIVPDA